MPIKNDINRNNEKDETGCWILDYKPDFNNLIIPKSHYTKLLNFIKNKEFNMNLYIYGLKGTNKSTLIKCCLKYCFDFDFDNFKILVENDNIFNYKNFYYIDFKFIKHNEIQNILNILKSKCKLKPIFNYNKLIIIKNINEFNNYNILFLKNLIETYSIEFRFIIINDKIITKIKPFFCCFKTIKLENNELKKLIVKILKGKNIDYKSINFKKIYKIYNDSICNLKETLLWLQYSIHKKDTGNMLIHQKMVAKLLNLVFSTNSYDDYENIRKMYLNLIGIGISSLNILKNATYILIKNDKINDNKKIEIINLVNNLSIKHTQIDKHCLILDKFFNNLISMFNDN